MESLKLIKTNPPRFFKVGINQQITIKDSAKIKLDSNEQVTFITKESNEFDIVSKEWGFYATPSINERLKNNNFKTALVKNSFNKYYVLLVNKSKIQSFHDYLDEEKQYLVEWLDER
tara:strand:- start:1901 stop:2251 length:351 start_codon:yes stop_codon:yes gene_type:complete